MRRKDENPVTIQLPGSVSLKPNGRTSTACRAFSVQTRFHGSYRQGHKRRSRLLRNYGRALLAAVFGGKLEREAERRYRPGQMAQPPDSRKEDKWNDRHNVGSN
jgi:hypothetical protein